MDQSVGSTIEKIKLQEQDVENKLKEKREYEAAILSLNRGIRDTLSQAEKSEQKQFELSKRIEKLRPLLEIEKIKRNALSCQLKTFTSILEDLKAKSDKGITNVWNLRSTLCEAVHDVSNECDIWGLLIRPVYTEPLPVVANKNESDENISINEGRLQAALSRRAKAEAERERLLMEPDSGEEFVRIKNALRYSLDKISNLKK